MDGMDYVKKWEVDWVTGNCVGMSRKRAFMICKVITPDGDFYKIVPTGNREVPVDWDWAEARFSLTEEGLECVFKTDSGKVQWLIRLETEHFPKPRLRAEGIPVPSSDGKGVPLEEPGQWEANEEGG